MLIINLITQVGLNLVLFFLVNQTGGSGFFYYLYYIMAEFVVFAIEAVFYCAKEPKFSEKRAELATRSPSPFLQTPSPLASACC